MHQILLGGGYTPTKAAGMPYGPSWSLDALIMAEISKANFGDLHEKETVFIEFLEIIHYKHRGTCANRDWTSSKFLRIELPEVVCVPGVIQWVSLHIF